MLFGRQPDLAGITPYVTKFIEPLRGYEFDAIALAYMAHQEVRMQEGQISE